MNENLTPSRQVRQTVFATLREVISTGAFEQAGAFTTIEKFFHAPQPTMLKGKP